jgi:hypothetical protein
MTIVDSALACAGSASAATPLLQYKTAAIDKIAAVMSIRITGASQMKFSNS